MLAYWKTCYILNFGIFRTQGIFRILFIYAHSGVFNNDIYSNTINFLSVSAARRRRDRNTVVSVGSRAEKFDIVTTMDARTSAIFSFSTGNSFFGQIWSKKKKIKIVNLSGNLVHTYNLGHNILELYNVNDIKRNVISSIANLAYELPRKLPNDSRLRILGNKEILGKSQIWAGTCA